MYANRKKKTRETGEYYKDDRKREWWKERNCNNSRSHPITDTHTDTV